MRLPVLAISLAIVLGLSACAPSSPEAESPPTAPPSTQSTPAQTPTATGTVAPVTVPTDCSTLVDAATAASTFGDTPLNDPALGYTDRLGVISPTEPAAGATPEQAVDAATRLRCMWRYPQADITYLQVQIGSVTAGVGSDYLETLQSGGYSCDDLMDGKRCSLTSIEPQYQTDAADTAFARDGIVIRIDQANFPTDNLLSAIVAGIWPDAG